MPRRRKRRPTGPPRGSAFRPTSSVRFYRRGAFVCEGKRVKAGAQTKAFDDALLRARSQAEGYARALPASEGRPPFLLVVDVGHLIEVYAEFTRTGATYTPFPDPRSHRIGLADLTRLDIQERPSAVWLDPLSLWPEADFVVGNPPFIGNKRMRIALGDGYVEALRAAWNDVPDSADFVMYWWDHAAWLAQEAKLRRFGLITTNSVRQTFSRRVIEQHLGEAFASRTVVGRVEPQAQPDASEPDRRVTASPAPDLRTLPASGRLSLVFAIPDHPWVDSADGAAVRIAMTVGGAGDQPGRLVTVSDEREGGGEGVDVTLAEWRGAINADLSVGADVSSAVPLHANSRLSNRGMIPHGEGFLATANQGALLDRGALLRPYRNGRDLTDRPRGVFVIDTFGLTEEDLRHRYPATWQWLHDRVKPERDHNSRKARRENWWLFGENQPRMRASVAGLRRYVATGQTAKHRFFQFLDAAILPDDKLIAIALDDAYALGVLSSGVHVTWALAAGGSLGVGDDPVYNKSKCFDAFPFPAATPDQKSRIRYLAEQLDAHRKRQQAQHPDLTLTGLYNVLEKLKAGQPISGKEKDIHQKGLVSVLKTLHDEIDRAVLEAYGWADLLPLMDVVNGNVALKGDLQGDLRGGLRGGLQGAPQTGRSGFSPTSKPGSPMTRDAAKRLLDETLLDRLVALNAERAAEEKHGLIRWLRPEFQNPQGAGPAVQTQIESTDETATVTPVTAVVSKQPWPKELTEQIKAVAAVLAEARGPKTEDDLAARFTSRGRWRERLPKILEMLVALGRAHARDGAYVARA